MTDKQYEEAKKILCELVDLAKEHNEDPFMFVHLTTLETLASGLCYFLAQRVGENAIIKWLEILQRCPLAVVTITPEELRARLKNFKRLVSSMEEVHDEASKEGCMS